MDREEKKTRVLRQDGKVFAIGCYRTELQFLNPRYELVRGAGEITQMGRLTVFEIKPKDGDGPIFSARWDGGSRDPGKAERFELDVDIGGTIAGKPVSNHDTTSFKRGENGFAGHHTESVPTVSGHAFGVCIRTPSERIFKGKVSFDLERKLELGTTTNSEVTLGMTVIRASDKKTDSE